MGLLDGRVGIITGGAMGIGAGVGNYLQLIDDAEHGAVAAHKYFRAFRDPKIAQGRLLRAFRIGPRRFQAMSSPRPSTMCFRLSVWKR